MPSDSPAVLTIAKDGTNTVALLTDVELRAVIDALKRLRSPCQQQDECEESLPIHDTYQT